MNYDDLNRLSWNRRVEIHVDSEMYDIQGFLAGENSLCEIELAELGAVANKSLLHLQCHFGLDSLSWARQQARVTGVDYSENGIATANRIKQQCQLEAEFICSHVFDFNRDGQRQFDIVFSSYGVLCWLSDLQQWADTIRRSLKPNGIFYLVEFHPAYDLFMGNPYFHSNTPDLEDEPTYTENHNSENLKAAYWAHSISDIIMSLSNAGIALEHLHEFPFTPHNCFPNLLEKEPGRFYCEYQSQNLPMTFSIRGSKIDV